MGTHLRLNRFSSTMAPYERKAEREMRMQDVQKMCLDDGKAMVVVDGRVYDLTMWKHAHPGGETIINDFVGQDASDAFRVFHPEEVREKMKVFDKGAVSDYVRSPISEDFKELHEAFLEEGLYDSYMPYFVAKFVGCLVALAGALYLGWNAEALGGEYSWAVVAAGATLLALHFHQLAFMGHDLCHNGVTHVREYDYLFSLTVGGALGGISSGWWKRSHNVHHCVTNSVNHDPDIQHLPVFGLSEKHLDGFFSTFHNRFMPYDAVADMFIRVQHYLYYPIMALARFNLYLQSWIMLQAGDGRVPCAGDCVAVCLSGVERSLSGVRPDVCAGPCDLDPGLARSGRDAARADHAVALCHGGVRAPVDGAVCQRLCPCAVPDIDGHRLQLAHPLVPRGPPVPGRAPPVPADSAAQADARPRADRAHAGQARRPARLGLVLGGQQDGD